MALKHAISGQVISLLADPAPISKALVCAPH